MWAISLQNKEFEVLKIRLPKAGQIIIDCNGIEEIDTASMLFFIGIRKALKSGLKVSAMGMTPSFLRLFRVMLRYSPVQ
ncbi:MAG: hypothetical protein ACUVQ6_05525 [Dissulfurimicrobium sp.]|uniref:hypothetical protein n=1 Tax=Dissulfurimicrobium sp. TaxID=2022436 RepID=UPI004049C7CC